MMNSGNSSVIPGRDPESRSAWTPDQVRGDKRVLFLALSGIGNLVMQLPAIRAVKLAHPEWHITVWVAPRGTKDIALSQPFIDEVIEMAINVSPPAREGVRGGGRVAMQHIKNISVLRNRHFDIGIVLSPGQLLKSAGYLFFARIPIRVGNTYPLKSNPHSKLFLTHGIDEDPSLHDIEQNLLLLQPLGITSESNKHYSLEIPEKNKQEAKGFLPSYEGRLGGVDAQYNHPLPSLTAGRSPSYEGEKLRYIGLHAGCAKGFEFKRWPLERFAEVARTLVQQNPDVRILVFGGKDEAEQNKELVDMINSSNFSPSYEGEREGVASATSPPPRHNGGGSPLSKGEKSAVAFSISAPLLTTAGVMKQCKLFLSNDSGLMHIAAATGVPTLGLFGPTDEKLTGPRGKLSYVLRAPDTAPVYNTEASNSFGNSSHETMLEITVKMVNEKIQTIQNSKDHP